MRESGQSNEYGEGSEFGGRPVNPLFGYDFTPGDTGQTEITAPGGGPEESDDNDGARESYRLPDVHPPESDPRLAGLPRFIVPHDGTQPEVTPEEQEAVTTAFDSLLSGMMQANPDSVGHVAEEDVLNGRIPVSDAAAYNTLLRDGSRQPEAGRGSDKTVKAISLQLIGLPSGRGYACVEYRKSTDGIVRRFTFPTRESLPPRRSAREALTATAADISVEDLIRSPVAGANLSANYRLLEEMRMQNQPVGADEIHGLANLLRRPEFKASLF